MRIDVRSNLTAVKADLDKLEKNIQERAIARALNRTAESGRTQMNRGIAQEFNVKQADVRSQIALKKAREGSGTAFLTAVIEALRGKRGRGINVIRFMERKVSLTQQRKRIRSGDRQLHFKIRRSGGQKIIQGAFIGNKGRTVFKRVGRDRLPIKPVSTIDVAQMFNTRRINSKVVAHIEAQFPIIMQREVKFYVERFGK